MGECMSKHKVEFDAHKVVKQETEVEFTKRDGTPVHLRPRSRSKSRCMSNSEPKTKSERTGGRDHEQGKNCSDRCCRAT